MSSIDERVVEMQFDNDQFESGIKQSTDSLDKFKNSLDLDGASKGLDNVSKAVSQFTMDGVTTAVETSSHSFSALETVATSALVTITSQAVQAGEQLLESLSIDQITAGYDKYTQKLSNVQTIMNSTGDDVETVNGYMDHLMWYSDETSYGFTDMTTALANMVSTGGDVETLIPMIEGVANATAYAGQNAQSFSTVISAINSAYSRGYMQATDWKRIQYQSAASKDLQLQFIETAEALGKLEEGSVTLENFASSLANGDTAGWLDTEVMEQTFGVFSEMTEKAYELIDAGVYDTATEAYAALEDQYGDLAVAAAEAAQKAKTFQEAIDATTDAVSSKWSAAMQTIFGDYNQATQLWTDVSEELYDAFAEPIQGLADMLSEAFGGESAASAFDEVSKQVENTGVSFEDFRDTLNTVMGEEGFGTLIRETGSVKDAFDSLDMETRSRLTSEAIDKLCGSTTAAGMSMDELEDVARRVWRGDFGNGEERVQALTEAGYDYEVVQAAVNQLINEGAINFDEYSDAELEAMGYSEETIAALRELQDSIDDTGSAFHKALSGMTSDGMTGFEALWGGIWNLKDIFVTVCDAIGAAWRDVFPATTADQIRNALLSFYNITSSVLSGVEGSVTKLQSVFRGLFSIVATAKDIIVSVAKAGFNILQSAIGNCNIDILGTIASIGDLISSFRKWFTENEIAQKITDGLIKTVSNLGKGLVTLKDNFLKLPVVQSVMSSLSKVGTSALNVLNEKFPVTTRWIKTFIGQFKNLGKLNFKFIVKAFESFGSELSKHLTNKFPETSNAISNFVDKFNEDFTSIKLSDITGIFKSFKTEFTNAINDLIESSDFLKSVRDNIDKFIADFKELTGIDLSFEGIKKAFSDLGNNIKEFAKTHFPQVYQQIVDFVHGIQESFDNFSFESIINIIKAFKDDFVNAINDFIEGNEFLSGVRDKINAFVEGVKEFFNLDFSGVGEAFSSLKESISTAITDILTSLGILKTDSSGDVEETASGLESPLQTISDAFSSVKEALGNFGTAIGTAFSNINIGKILGIVAAIGGIYALFKTGSLISGVGSFVSSLSDIGSAIKSFSKQSKIKTFGTTVKSLATALLELVAAVAVLGKLDKGELTQGLAALGIMAVGLIGLYAALGALDKAGYSGGGEGVKNIAAVILSFAAAVLIIVEALKELTKFQNEIQWQSVVALIGIIAAVLAAIIAFNKTSKGSSGGNSLGAAATILAFAESIKIIVSAFKQLTKFQDDIDGPAVASLITIIIAVLGAIAVFNVTSKGNSFGSGAGVAAELLAFAESIKIIVSALKQITKFSDDIDGPAAAAFLVTLAAVIGAILAFNLTSKGTSLSSSIGVAAELIAFAESIKIIVSALKTITEISGDLDEMAITAFVAVLVTVIGSLLILSKMNTGSLSSSIGIALDLIAVSASIKIAVDALVELSEASGSLTAGAIAGLVITMVVIVGSLELLSHTVGPEALVAGAAMLAVAVALKVAISALTDLATLSADTIAPAIENLITILVDSLLEIGERIPEILEALIEVIINAIKSLPTAIINALGFESFGDVGTAISGLVQKIVNWFKDIPSKLKEFFSSDLVQSIITAVKDFIKSIPEKIKSALSKLGELGSTIGNSISNFISGLPGAIGGAISSFGEMIGGPFGDIISTIGGAISGIPDAITAFVGDPVGFIADCISSIGEFILGLPGAIIEGAGEWLVDMGEGIDGPFGAIISGIGNGLLGIGDGIDTVVGDVEGFVGDIQEKVGDFVSGIPDAITNAGESLEEFGEGVDGPFGTIISGVGSAISGIGSGITELVGDPEGFIEGVGEDIGTFITGIPDKISGIIDDIGDFIGEESPIGGFISDVKEGIGGLPGKIEEAVGDIGTDVGGVVETVTGAVSDFVSNIEEGVKDFDLESALSTVTEGVGTAIETVSTTVSTIATDLGLDGIPEEISGAVGTFVENVTTQLEGFTLEGALSGVEQVCQSIGTSIGEFVGGIVGGVAEGFTADMPDTADNMSDFMTNLTPFLDSFESLDTSVFTKISDLAVALTKLTGADLLTGLKDFIFGDDDLSKITTSIKGLADGLSDCTWEDPTQMVATLDGIAEAVATLKGIKNGGNLDDVLGSGNKALGPLLAQFADDISGCTWPTDASQMKTTLTAIADSASVLDGVNLDTFTAMLETSGESLSTFADSIQGIDWPDTSMFNELVAALSDMCQNVDPAEVTRIATELQEALQKFDGITAPTIIGDIDEFSTSLNEIEWPDDFGDAEACATALQTACDAFEDFTFPDISEDIATFTESFSTDTWPTEFPDITASATALETACTEFTTITFPDISESIGAFIESISSDSWPTSFPDISASATAMETACKEFESIEFPSIAKDIADFITSLSLASWPLSYPSVDASATALQTAIDQFGTISFPSTDTLTNFATTLSSAMDGAGDAGGQAMIDALLSYEGKAGDAGTSLIKDTADGMKNTVGSVTSACKSICDAAVSVINSYQGSFSSAGASLIRAMASGISGAVGSVTGAVGEVCRSAVNATNGYNSSMYNAGLNMAQGYANGIAAGTNAAINAAANMAAQAIKAVNDAQASASPSRVTYKSGMWFDQGYANGIAKFIPLIKTAAVDAANTAVDSLSGEMDSMANLISDEMNLNPVITPVLDLSQVRSGAASLNGMLLTTPNLTIDTNQVARTSGSVSAFRSAQMNSNSDLLEAIQGLSGNFGESRGDTYNINGISYDEGSEIADAVKQLVRASMMSRRV